jgi:hypothetical protein
VKPKRRNGKLKILLPMKEAMVALARTPPITKKKAKTNA